MLELTEQRHTWGLPLSLPQPREVRAGVITPFHQWDPKSHRRLAHGHAGSEWRLGLRPRNEALLLLVWGSLRDPSS